MSLFWASMLPWIYLDVCVFVFLYCRYLKDIPVEHRAVQRYFMHHSDAVFSLLFVAALCKLFSRWSWIFSILHSFFMHSFKDGLCCARPRCQPTPSDMLMLLHNVLGEVPTPSNLLKLGRGVGGEQWGWTFLPFPSLHSCPKSLLICWHFANRLQAVCVDLYRGGVSFHFITILLSVNIMKLTHRDSHDTSSTWYSFGI